MTLTHKEIEKRRQELQQQLAELDRLSGAVSAVKAAPRGERRSSPSPSRSIRDLVIDSLDEIGFMTYTQQLTIYLKARFGREVAPTRFGTLSADEQRAFTKGGVRAMWLAHGLTHDRAEPVKRLWGRSDWSLERRLVTPSFGRIQYLSAASRFTELAMKAESIAANPDLLRYLAADLARDLGVTVRRGSFDLEMWKAAADEQLAGLVEQEKQILVELAASWMPRLSEEEALFGRASKPIVVSVGRAREA